MAQSRYHNYNRPLASLDENHRILGNNFPGIKCGFDALAAVAGNAVAISHGTSGVQKTNADASVSAKMGCVVTRQGFFIYEDEDVQVNVDFNPSSNWRVDLLILQHSYLASAGGSLATYSVLKGADNAPGVTPPNFSYPTVSNPATQVPIGYIFIPAGAVDHTGTKYRRLRPTLSGKEAFLKEGVEVPTLDNTVPLNSNFNYIMEAGIYYVNTATNAPSGATTEWFLIVMRKGVMVVQFAQAKTSGKAYVRGTLDGTTWQPWGSLNNSDITASITNLETAIGDRLYTENNYIVDAETITLSINKLDIEVKDLEDLITAASTSISTLSAAIGDQTYTTNNYILDGESLSDSLDKLDIALKGVSDNIPVFKSVTEIVLVANFAGAADILASALPGIKLGFWCTITWNNCYPDQGVLSYSNITTLPGYNLLRASQEHRHGGASGGGALTVNNAQEMTWFCPLAAGQTGRFTMGHYNGSGAEATIKIRGYC